MSHPAADLEHDFYELLQISPNAEPETIHRVYRLLAQRYHPDNLDTGDHGRFRALLDAYEVLSDPERRAQYDVAYQRQRQERWRPVVNTADGPDPIDAERSIRTRVLEVLYERRRTEPGSAGVFILDIEQLTGHPREHLEFTLWYLVRKNLVAREDGSKLSITADGVDYLEDQHGGLGSRKRLEPHRDSD